MYGYIQAKSKFLIEKGIEAYREEDFFRHPPRNLSDQEEHSLLSAALQIVDGRGKEDDPIIDVDLNHLIVLAHCFHFQVSRITSENVDGRWHDILPLRHVVSGSEVVLHLNSGQETERRRSRRKEGVFQTIGPEYPAVLRRYPQLVSSEMSDRGQWGDFRYKLHTKCVAQGDIVYRHVLLCYALHLRDPCLAVTAEVSVSDPEELFLCTFEGARHKNKGTGHQIASLDDFQTVAYPLAKSVLGVEE